jgi:hypothetical protein
MLGEKFQRLPENWEYRVQALDDDLAMRLTPEVPIPSIQDELIRSTSGFQNLNRSPSTKDRKSMVLQARERSAGTVVDLPRVARPQSTFVLWQIRFVVGRVI